MNTDATFIEYVHSSEIIEFFFFALSLAYLAIIIIKFFVFNDKSLSHSDSTPKKEEIKKDIKIESKEKEAKEKINEEANKLENIENPALEKEINNNNGSNVVLDEIVINVNPHSLGQPKETEQSNVSSPTKNNIKKPIEKKHLVLEKIICQIEKNVPYLGIVVINIVSFSTYIYMAFFTCIWIVCIILFNGVKIFKKYDREKFQILSEFFHYIIIFSFFLNYFINDQSRI